MPRLFVVAGFVVVLTDFSTIPFVSDWDGSVPHPREEVAQEDRRRVRRRRLSATRPPAASVPGLRGTGGLLPIRRHPDRSSLAQEEGGHAAVRGDEASVSGQRPQ